MKLSRDNIPGDSHRPQAGTKSQIETLVEGGAQFQMHASIAHCTDDENDPTWEHCKVRRVLYAKIASDIIQTD
jgi:hypothetical protein